MLQARRALFVLISVVALVAGFAPTAFARPGMAAATPSAAPATAARASARANTAPAAAASQSLGYWLVAADGGVFSGGDATFHGSTGAIHLTRPIVGIAATPSGGGYWAVASDGGVFAFGDAAFHGSTGAIHLNKPIVGIASTPSGHGYWMVASDGGIFAFGDAAFHGSTGAMHLNKPIVGIASSPSGHGYRMVASDGGVFSFGDAVFYGSTGAIHLNSPIVGMAPTASGHGYWFVAADGGVFAFGDAGFFGSAGAMTLTSPIVGMVATAPVPNSTKLAFSTQPGDSTGGLVLGTQPVVTVEDASGARATHDTTTVHLTLTGAGPATATPSATFGCDSDAKVAVGGVATFAGCAIDVAGTYTLTATDGTLTPAVSESLTVSVGPAAQLQMSVQPLGAVHGVALTNQPVVRVEDAGGNLVTAGTSVVTLALTTPHAGTPALTCTTALTRTTASGLATFAGCAVDTTGDYTLTATDPGLTSVTSTQFEITDVASQFAFTTPPSAAAAAGAAFASQPVVTIQDSSGHTVVASTNLVTLAKSGSGTGALVCTSNAVNAVAGVATFAGCHFNVVGSYAVTASGAFTTITSGAVVISAGVATQLVFTAAPSATASGGTVFGAQPTVTVEDAFGNTVTTPSTITLSLTGAPAGAALACTGTDALPTTAGVAIFAGCAIDKASVTPYTLTATSAGHTVVSSGITVSAGVATHVVFTAAPSATGTGGTAWLAQPTVTVEDAGGNTVTAANSVTLSITGGAAGAALTCTGTDVHATASGVAAFVGCAIDKSSATPYILTATATTGGSVGSANLVISTGVASQLVYTGVPSTTGTGGTAWLAQPTVTVEDAGGNTVTTANSVTLSLVGSPAGAVLTCTGTDVHATASGVAAFVGCAINKSSVTAYNVRATATTGGSVDSADLVISTGVASQLVFTTQPGDTTGGLPFSPQPVVTVEDAGGNTVTTANSVTLAITGTTTSTLACTNTSPLPTVTGVATFTGCNIDLEGTYTLTATGAGQTVVSADVGVAVGLGAALKFLVQPVGSAHAVNFPNQPTVAIVDAGGNVVTSDVSGVTLTNSGPGVGVLTCTANPKTASEGSAIFAGCKLSLAGSYVLTASDLSEPGLGTVDSGTVTIT